MVKMNFESAAVDNLFRSPRDRNAGTPSGHHDNVAVGTSLKKTDVAIMREDFGPQLQIRRCLEDCQLWRLHEQGIGCVHPGCRYGKIQTAHSIDVRGFYRSKHPSPKIIFVKGENL